MKRFIIILLSLAALFNSLPTAYAANKPETAMNNASIYAYGDAISYLNYDGEPKSITPAYYTGKLITGEMFEFPAYCITPHLPGPHKVGTYSVDTKDYIANPKIYGIVTNGYPYKSIGEIGVHTREQAYYATKMALWTYINNWDVNLWAPADGEQGITLTALKKIYTAGMTVNEIKAPVLTATPDMPTMQLDSINPNFASQTYSVTANMEIRSYEVFLKGNVPDGTKVVDINNNPKTVFNAGEQFKVLIPSDQISGAVGTFEIGITGELRTNAIIYGLSYDSSLQDFSVTRDPFDFQDTTATAAYSSQNTFIEIYKLETGTSKPLSGAVFRVTHSEGGVIGTFSTDANGRVVVPLTKSGAYQVEEITPPVGYVLDKTSHKDVIVLWEQTTTVTFTNETASCLEIQKLDADTGKRLSNAVVRVAWEGGMRFVDVITDAAGVAYIKDLVPGAYTVTELVAPDGYILNDTSQPVILEAGKTSAITVANHQKPGLVIKKYDEDDGTVLSGAEFSVAKKGGSVVYEGITDKTGTIRIEGLDEGWYTITEIAPPSGYLIAVASKDVYLESGKTVEIKFDNRLRPALRILKVDTITGERLPNAEFRLSKVEDGTVSEYITDTTGEILITDLDEAIYRAEEFNPPDGYIRCDEAKEVLTEWGKVKTLKFDNIRKPVVIFLKTNALTGKGIPGATFKVEYETPGGGLKNLGSYKTDADGRIIIPKAEPGWYVFTETMPASGFSLPKNPVTRMYFAPGDNAYLAEFEHYYTGTGGIPLSVPTGTAGQVEEHSGSEYYIEGESFNWPLNSVIIKKTNAITGELLAGATFELYRADEQVSGVPGTTIGRYTTDNSGIVVITGLEPGYYVVKEVQAPQNFLISENSQQNGFLKADGTTILEFTFANYPYGSLLISKVDALTGTPLANARFRVTDSSGAVVGNSSGEYVTDSNGEILIPNVKPSAYVVTEIQAPANYAINTTPKTVQVGTDGKVYKVTFDNYPYGEIVIRKMDSVSREPLSGAEFKVTDSAGGVVGGSNGIFVTDAQGIIRIPNLPKGSYVIEEIKAPSGYILENQTRTVTVDYGKTYTIDVYNKKMSGLQIVKIDADSKQPLKGANFTVYKMNGEVMGSYETNGEGIIILDRLEPGWYKVVETKAPDGWLLDDTPQDVQITDNQFIKLVFENRALASLQIKKLDEYSSAPLGEAIFEVRRQNGAFVGEFTTDQSGAVSIPAVEPGWYVIKEIKAPSGYILTDAVKTVEVKATVPTVVTVTNKPLSGLKIIKIDSESRQPIEGVEFVIAKMSGEKVMNEFNGNSFKTDKTGQIYIPGLADGYYTVTETTAASGYILDAEPKTVLIESGKPTVLEVLNTPMTGLRLIKIDSITKKGIYNVEFMVFDKNGWVVGTFYTDNNGVIEFAGILPEGRYTIRETRAAEGYYRDDVPRTVEFKAGQVTEIRWENTPQMAQIQILKKSGDDNEVNGLPAGTPLAGAIFEAYDYKSGNLVDRFLSGANGWAVSKPLHLGRYVVKEVQAPQWYKLSTQTLDIDLEFAMQIVKMEFLNYAANTGVYIKKTGVVECMPGDTIRYDIKAVQNTGTTPLTDFYWRDTLPVDAVRLSKIVTGTYNQSLKYKVLASTNKGDTRIIADNLSTTRNNVIDCSGASLGLKNDEYIINFTLIFGTVKAGFAQVEQPQIYVKALSTLQNGYQFANKADVGGKYGREWVVGNSTWLTKVYKKPSPLPRTGY